VDDEELLQMMNNLEECLANSTLCKSVASYMFCAV